MKIIAKTKAILIQTKAETMVEVIVAFVVLSIVMALFAQGLNYATSAEVYAIENGKDYDQSMIYLQKTIAGSDDDEMVVRGTPETEDLDASNLEANNGLLILSEYSVKSTGDIGYYHYWVFDANLG